MRYKEAYKQFNGRDCILNSPTWGAYYCKEVEIVKGENGKRWKAIGKIATIVILPLQSRPPLKEDYEMSVSQGNVWLPDEGYTPVYPYEQAFYNLIKSKRREILDNRMKLESGERHPSESFNDTLFRIMLAQLANQEANFNRRLGREQELDESDELDELDELDS